MFISEIDQIVATHHLQQTWDRLKLLQQELTSDLSGTEVDLSETSSTDDDLDILIKAREKAAEQSRQFFTLVIFTSNNAMQRNSIMVLLTSFANEPRLGKNKNVLQYWKQFKESKRELYELSQVVLAVPATQASVEIAFSGLKYILSPLRTNMSEQLLKDILLIRSNHLLQQ